MRENIDFVSYEPNMDTSLVFVIAGKTRKISEERVEILGVVRKIFDITKGFFIPTEVGYGLYLYPADTAVNNLTAKENGRSFSIVPTERSYRVVKSRAGVSYDDLIDDINSVEAQGKIKYIYNFNFNSGKTYFVLGNTEEYIDKNSRGRYALMTERGIIDKAPSEDPVRIRISQSPFKSEDQWVEISDPAYYEVHISIYSNIWFEKSEIGRANLQMFRKVLKEIYDSFDVVDSMYLSDKMSEDWLTDIIPNLSV